MVVLYVLEREGITIYDPLAEPLACKNNQTVCNFLHMQKPKFRGTDALYQNPFVVENRRLKAMMLDIESDIHVSRSDQVREELITYSDGLVW